MLDSARRLAYLEWLTPSLPCIPQEPEYKVRAKERAKNPKAWKAPPTVVKPTKKPSKKKARDQSSEWWDDPDILDLLENDPEFLNAAIPQPELKCEPPVEAGEPMRLKRKTREDDDEAGSSSKR